jgi:hypothetical protein
LALNKQIYCYSVDTSDFYEGKEKSLHEIMTRLYGLRFNVKEKLSKKQKKDEDKEIFEKRQGVYNFQVKRLNKWIKQLKQDLIAELEKFNGIRVLDNNKVNDLNVVSIFDSCLTRTFELKQGEFTDNIIIIRIFYFNILENIIKDGFYFKNEKYIFYTASAGQIRTKKCVFIKESAWNKYKDTLMCGLTLEHINKCGGINTNKLLAYLALNNSATEKWDDFDIDKSIVVEDFENDITGTVDFIDDKDYSISRIERANTICHTDGCGMMLDEKTRMCRLPWIKGLMVTFPFNEFIKEKNLSGIVKDIWGKEHDVLREDIKYIFTKSQMKMWKYYDNWEQYKSYFKKFNCSANYCNLEEDKVKRARINYQMLQSLCDMTEVEMRAFAKNTVRDINNIGEDFPTMMRVLGAVEDNVSKNCFQEAVYIYPELMQDKYSKEILKAVKKKMVKEARAGRLEVNGHYRFVSPDLYAFCEFLFEGKQNPQGLLKDGEVFAIEFDNNATLDCLRSPHLYREHALRKNVITDEKKKYYITNCVYTSCHDLISRILQFDCDGDTLLIIQDKNFSNIVERHMEGIVPLYYDAKKAAPVIVDNQAFYDNMVKAFTNGNIGIYSNNISKIWNNGSVGEEELATIKLLCMENNYVIDAAKTLYVPTRTAKADKQIKKYTKNNLPHFFIYAKDKNKEQVEPLNDSVVNKLEKIIPSNRLTFNKKIGKMDWHVLCSNIKYEPNEKSYEIGAKYDYLNKRQNIYFRNSGEVKKEFEQSWAYSKMRSEITSVCDDIDEVVNALCYILYKERPESTKTLLWSCFGNEILSNIKKNVADMNPICPSCGKRFVPHHGHQRFCSTDCVYVEYNRRRRLKK